MSIRPPQRDEFVSERQRSPRNSFFATTRLSYSAAAVLALLLALRGLPVIAYRLNLPLWVFYVLLIGGGIAALLIHRRWKRILPAEEPAPDPDHLETPAARREAKIWLIRYAFHAVPVLAAIAAVIYFGVYQRHGTSAAFAVAAGFAIGWNVFLPVFWQGLVLPLLRKP